VDGFAGQMFSRVIKIGDYSNGKSNLNKGALTVMPVNEKSTSWLSCIIHSFLLCLSMDLAATEQLPSDRIIAAKLADAKSLVLLDQPTLSVEQAYSLQNTVIESLSQSSPVVGFKAGLTSSAGASQYKLTEPVAGVLLSDMVSDIRLIKQADFHAGKIEVELGYRLKQTVNATLALDEVEALIDQVVAVIELPDLGFDQQAKIRGVDIIANNVGAKRLIIGNDAPASRIDTNAMTISLAKDGKIIQQLALVDQKTDQITHLHWLINRLIKNGKTIQKGQLLITGSLGPMLDARVGVYTADFAGLGRIRFTIE